MCLADRFIASLQCPRIHQRPQDSRTQQPFAHRRLALVQGVKQRGPRILPHKQWFHQFEIAYRHLVQFQRSGRNRRRFVPHQPISFERPHAELPLHQRYSKFTRPDPILNACPRRNPLERCRQLRARSHKHLACPCHQNRVRGQLPRIRPVKLRRPKLSGRDIQ